MEKSIFYSIVLSLIAVCACEQSFGQIKNDREILFLTPDTFLQSTKPYSYGREKFDQFRMQIVQKKSHQIEDLVQLAWVQHYASVLVPGFDGASDIAVDGWGNVYVTGTSATVPYETYLTIKYDADGNQLWSARYCGDGSGDNAATAICVDKLGNVYVTGYSTGAGSGSDYTTIKYNPDGVEQWIARYNGPVNHTDMPRSMVVDDSGNVYVTGVSGYSYGIGTHSDYATIKYNSDGTEQWTVLFNSPRNQSDDATDIAVDNIGNIYVTGNTYTIKYNAFGIEQWVVEPKGNACIADEYGYVYTTGGSGTIKYKSTGEIEWTAACQGCAIVIDDSMNVYVAGTTSIHGDYIVFKYNSVGAELWKCRYNGPGNSREIARDIAIDDSGNVYITGSSGADYATVKYNSSGVQQWVARYNGPGSDSNGAIALELDEHGNIYVTGSSGAPRTNYDWLRFAEYVDIATIKYSTADGHEQWVARYNGPGYPHDWATAFAVDDSNNVYITGKSVAVGTSWDYATVKYNSKGSRQWVTRYNGPVNLFDQPSAMIVNSIGDIIVTGKSMGIDTSWDIATVKYNSAGEEQWIARYSGQIRTDEVSTAIASDSLGNIYVIGGWGEPLDSKLGINYGYFLIIKYNSSGEEQWVARYHDPNDSKGMATCLAIDDAGNIYVSGINEVPGSNTLFDYITIQYNNDGVEQWIDRYDGPAHSLDIPTDIRLDDLKNIYVTGYSLGMDSNFDFATIKYKSSGDRQWVARSNGSSNNSDQATSIGIDKSGNVYVTGWSYNASMNSDYMTVKYDSFGKELWTVLYNGSGNDDDQATSLAIDDLGNIYVTGTSMGSSTDNDFVTIKYSSEGAEQWVTRFNGPANAIDVVAGLAIDNLNNVYVAGTSWRKESYKGDPLWNIYTVIKYTQTPTSIKQEILNYPKEYSLSQNYPNPFNPTTTIRFALPRESFVILKIYNLLGEEEATLVAGLKPMGAYHVQWQAGDLPSGVYLCRLKAYSLDGKKSQQYADVKKLVLIK